MRATPLTMERRRPIKFSAYSSNCACVMVADLQAMYTIGCAAGFTFEYEGGVGILVGRLPPAREIAACTSCAAASMLRLRSNCSVMFVEPNELVDDMLSIPAMVENSFSSGVATDDAIVSGFAPGSAACTWMVGYSTVGRSLTGNPR